MYGRGRYSLCSADNGKTAAIEAFTNHTTRTVSEVLADGLPIVGAVGKEGFLRSQNPDVPKVGTKESYF